MVRENFSEILRDIIPTKTLSICSTVKVGWWIYYDSNSTYLTPTLYRSTAILNGPFTVNLIALLANLRGKCLHGNII